MTTIMQFVLKMRTLSEEQQRQVLDFIEHLPEAPKPVRHGLHGLWTGHDTTEEEIAEARKEMWSNSPSEEF